MSKKTIANLNKQLERAKTDVKVVEDDMRYEIDRATAAINKKYERKLERLRNLTYALDVEIWLQKVALAKKDKRFGKTVTRTKKVWSKRTSREVVLVGVVEVMDSDTILPGNIGWNRPSIGDLFVRLLKSDGEVGLQVDRLDLYDWEIAN